MPETKYSLINCPIFIKNPTDRKYINERKHQIKKKFPNPTGLYT